MVDASESDAQQRERRVQQAAIAQHERAEAIRKAREAEAARNDESDG